MHFFCSSPWLLAGLFVLAAGCSDPEPAGRPNIVYEVEGQDALRIKNEGGHSADSVDLIFRAGSGQARGCEIVGGGPGGAEVGSESELVSVTVSEFEPGAEVRVKCAAGTDLRYFRGETSSGMIVPFEEKQEIPFRKTGMLWVVFLSGIAVLMIVSFLLSLMLDRWSGRLGEAG